jgi:hypothetical protein
MTVSKPAGREREKMEKTFFKVPLDAVWEQTRAIFRFAIRARLKRP